MLDFNDVDAGVVGYLSEAALEVPVRILEQQQEHLDSGQAPRFLLRVSMLFATTMTWIETYGSEHDDHAPAACARRSVDETLEQVNHIAATHPELAEICQVHRDAIEAFIRVLDQDDEARQAEQS